MSHTPEPWTVRKHHSQCFDSRGKKRQCYQVTGPESLGDMECMAFSLEDARLIAAAPDLLKAAKLPVLSLEDELERVRDISREHQELYLAGDHRYMLGMADCIMEEAFLYADRSLRPASSSGTDTSESFLQLWGLQ